MHCQGDIGTSIIYVFSQIFATVGDLSDEEPDALEDSVLGAESLIFWSLTLIALVKYVGVVLRANDTGEGGAGKAEGGAVEGGRGVQGGRRGTGRGSGWPSGARGSVGDGDLGAGITIIQEVVGWGEAAAEGNAAQTAGHEGGRKIEGDTACCCCEGNQCYWGVVDGASSGWKWDGTGCCWGLISVAGG